MNDIKLNCLGQMDNSDGTLEMRNRVYDTNGIYPTITTATGGSNIMVESVNKLGNIYIGMIQVVVMQEMYMIRKEWHQH